ncbi:MAG: FkbM family methyltransferase [Kordiimonadaceae bacterium]|nr:FkbM family methyltransferase [Kordiimonadaceae bacterium]
MTQFNAELPFPIRIVKSIIALTGGRGQYFLRTMLQKLGLMEGTAKYQFFDGQIYVPLNHPATFTETDHTTLHGIREINFANAIYRTLGDFTLVDCGAAYGVVCMRLTKLCPTLKKVIAIDPNPKHCALLEKNLSGTDVDYDVLQAGVSDFTGSANIVFPQGQANPYSAYLEADEDGDIHITSIDKLTINPDHDIALKIDVEGEEVATFLGASATIKKAKNVCVFVEIHPETLRRKNIKAEDILQAASKLRKFKWMDADMPTHVIDETKPFFDQFSEVRQYDIISVSV